MNHFYTSGQIAKRLRISISTLKRWLEDSSLNITEQRNYNGWRLFNEVDLNKLLEFKRKLRKNGKRFNESTLLPVGKKLTTENLVAQR